MLLRVNPSGVKTLLANGFSTFLIKDKIVFSNGPKSLPKNPADCPILCDWVFSWNRCNFSNVFICS